MKIPGVPISPAHHHGTSNQNHLQIYCKCVRRSDRNLVKKHTPYRIRVLSNFPFPRLVVVKEFTATLSGLGPKKRPKAQMPMALPSARLLDLMWFKQFALAANRALRHSTNFPMPKTAKRLINHQSPKSKIPINGSNLQGT